MPGLFWVKPTRKEDAQRCPECSKESETLETRQRGDSECGGLGVPRGGDLSLQTVLQTPTRKGPFSAPDFCLTSLHTRPVGQLFSAEGGFASEGHVWPFLRQFWLPHLEEGAVLEASSGWMQGCYETARDAQDGGPATSRDLALDVHSAEVKTPP